MVAGEVHLAGRHQEVAVDEMHQPVGQVGREVGTEVAGAVLPDPPRDVDARVLLGRQLDVGVGLVVPQQDVEARLPLLDEVVLESQCLLLVIDEDVFDVVGFGDQACRSWLRAAAPR